MQFMNALHTQHVEETATGDRTVLLMAPSPHVAEQADHGPSSNLPTATTKQHCMSVGFKMCQWFMDNLGKLAQFALLKMNRNRFESNNIGNANGQLQFGHIKVRCER